MKTWLNKRTIRGSEPSLHDISPASVGVLQPTLWSSSAPGLREAADVAPLPPASPKQMHPIWMISYSDTVVMHGIEIDVRFCQDHSFIYSSLM